MRTTLSVDDNLLEAAKRRARSLGVTLGQLVETALRRELSRSTEPEERPDIPVFDGEGGLRPGIDATSTASLLEALDRDRPVEDLR